MFSSVKSKNIFFNFKKLNIFLTS